MLRVFAIRVLVSAVSLLLPYLSRAQLDYNLLELNSDSLYQYNGSLFDGVAEWKNAQDSGQVIVAFHFRSGSVYNHEFVYMEKGSVLATAYYDHDKKHGELRRFDKKGVIWERSGNLRFGLQRYLRKSMGGWGIEICRFSSTR